MSMERNTNNDNHSSPEAESYRRKAESLVVSLKNKGLDVQNYQDDGFITIDGNKFSVNKISWALTTSLKPYIDDLLGGLDKGLGFSEAEKVAFDNIIQEVKGNFGDVNSAIDSHVDLKVFLKSLLIHEGKGKIDQYNYQLDEKILIKLLEDTRNKFTN